jgi:transmembrane sensor
MKVDKKHIEDLWRRYVSGLASREELHELFHLLDDPTLEEIHMTAAQAATAEGGPQLEPDAQQEEANWQLLLQEAEGLRASLQPVPEIPVRSIRLPRWSWAAAIVVLLSAGSYYLFNRQQSKIRVEKITAVAPDIKPGKQGAVLTLANGRQVLLDSLSNAEIANESGTDVKISKGGLHYDATGNASPTEIFNTVTTPVGQQFNLLLADGSHVWLNAGSSLRYPVAFKGPIRRVKVTGEAYFEVSENADMPFVVNVGNRAEVKVLGTHFNINAYENEPFIQATLLKGAISTRAGKGSPVLLRPGQQARWSHTGPQDIQVLQPANPDNVIAWKRGFFNFENASLAEVMRTLERWYKVQVIYEKGIPDMQFGGELSMQIPLQGVLNALRKTKVHFRIENGNKLIVTP